MEEKIYFLAKDINEELNNNPDVVLLNELDRLNLNDMFLLSLFLNCNKEGLAYQSISRAQS